MRNHRSKTPLAIMYKLLALILLLCLLLGAPIFGGLERVQADDLPRGGRTGGTVPIANPTTEPAQDPTVAPTTEPTPAPPEVESLPEGTPPEEALSEEMSLSEPAQATPLAAQVRFGVATNSNPWDFQYFGDLKAGWYHNWGARAWELTAIPGVEYVPMVGAWGELWGSETEQMLRNYIAQCPDCYPDGTIWIVGNEPEYDQFDTINGEAITPRAITPDEYAQKYKKYYDMIKGINPTYKVAVGATYDDPSWPDATRCGFLPKARQAYESRYGEKMPIDVYTLHAYMDQLDAPLFQLETMVQRKRAIMNDYGDRDKPLLVTEVGVLTALRNPVPSTDAINAFMDSAFDYLSTATSEELGCPGDNNRMVQRWAWFALTSRSPSQGDDYWKGTDLLDIQTGNITPAGQTYAAYPRTPPPIPSGFWGMAKNNGANVADGTPVTAWIGGVQVAQTTTLTAEGSSVYSLDVPGDDPSTPERDGGNEGDTIQFKIGNDWANETATWHSGTTLKLDLTTDDSASHFELATEWVPSFSQGRGWVSQDMYPRMLADVNGDGKADIVGFYKTQTFVSLSNGSSFGPGVVWTSSFSQGRGWVSQDMYPRMLADVNGDGKADIVGFYKAQTFVSLSNGSSFEPGVAWTSSFSQGQGWVSQDRYPRMLADVNGDGKADIVGFYKSQIYVALSTGSSFGTAKAWGQDFTESRGWVSQDLYPRMLADVNGDGKADVVGFAADGAYVSLSSGSSFGAATRWTYSYGQSRNWVSQDRYPRILADVNGDGLADIVGFFKIQVFVSLSTGSSFGIATQWSQDLNESQGWTSQDTYLRTLADADGDEREDIIGFGSQSTVVALAASGDPSASAAMAVVSDWIAEEEAYTSCVKLETPSLWQGQFFAGKNLDGDPFLVDDTEQIRFNWDGESPNSSLLANGFSARWTRTLYLDEGEYDFYIQFDGGIRLFVDDLLIVDGWAEPNAAEQMGIIGLDAGWHTIVLECATSRLDLAPQLWWERRDIPSPDERDVFEFAP